MTRPHDDAAPHAPHPNEPGDAAQGESRPHAVGMLFTEELEDDRAWYRTHPHRRYRMRPAHDKETAIARGLQLATWLGLPPPSNFAWFTIVERIDRNEFVRVVVKAPADFNFDKQDKRIIKFLRQYAGGVSHV